MIRLNRNTTKSVKNVLTFLWNHRQLTSLLKSKFELIGVALHPMLAVTLIYQIMSEWIDGMSSLHSCSWHCYKLCHRWSEEGQRNSTLLLLSSLVAATHKSSEPNSHSAHILTSYKPSAWRGAPCSTSGEAVSTTDRFMSSCHLVAQVTPFSPQANPLFLASFSCLSPFFLCYHRQQYVFMGSPHLRTICSCSSGNLTFRSCTPHWIPLPPLISQIILWQILLHPSFPLLQRYPLPVLQDRLGPVLAATFLTKGPTHQCP